MFLGHGHVRFGSHSLCHRLQRREKRGQNYIFHCIKSFYKFQNNGSQHRQKEYLEKRKIGFFMTHRESRCILTRPISHGAFPLGPSVAVGVSFPPNVSRADSTECWYVARALSSPQDSGLLFPLKQTSTAWVRQHNPQSLGQPTLAAPRPVSV